MTKNNEEKSEGGNWWFNRYDYDYRSYDRSTTSGSRGWLSKLGGFDNDTFSYSNWYGNSSKDNSPYQGLLNQLQTSANLIGNKDKYVNVRWSNGEDRNSTKSDCIFLSPDNLIDGKSISEENIDAITGKVYLASVLRETVAPCAYNACQDARAKGEESGLHRGAVRIWEAIETSIARQNLMENWGGFGSYIALDAEKSSTSKDEVQAYIDSTIKSPNIDGATTAIAWNLLNPNDTIRIPTCYDKCVDSASEFLAEEISPQTRFRSSFSIALKIKSLLPIQEKEQEQKCNGKDEKSKQPPKLCDGSLLGEQVENKTDSSLSEQTSKDDKSERASSVSISHKGSTRLTSPEVFIKMESTTSYATAFASLIRKNTSSITSIRNSMLFLNNDIRFPSFGHRTGIDIDENSLHKLRLDDDRIMLRRDEVHGKKIAICLLVDESGSMSGHKIIAARDTAICLAQGMKGIDGVSVSIYGHTAEEGDREDCSIREYFTPRVKDMSTCMQMDGRCENHDGFAIQHTANAFNRDYGSYERKIMFVVSDGSPAGTDYNGQSAMDHTNEVNRACRKIQNIEVYGIGIDGAYDNSTGVRMYGQNNFVVLEDISSSLQIMSRFTHQIAMNIKK